MSRLYQFYNYITGSLYYKHVYRPIIFALFIELVLVIVIHPFFHHLQKPTEEVPKFIDRLSNPWNLSLALFTYIVTSTHALREYFGRYHEALETFKQMFSEFSKPVQGFGEDLVRTEKAYVGKKVNTQAAGGIVDVYLQEKIKLLSYMLKNEKKITSFLAPSFDLPSDLQDDEFLPFF